MQVACSIVLLFLTLEPDPVFGLRYNFGDGSYFVGSVDYQGRPSGQGQYHNSSGHLGKLFEICNKYTKVPFNLVMSSSWNWNFPAQAEL